jgi:hypothetical protein
LRQLTRADQQFLCAAIYTAFRHTRTSGQSRSIISPASRTLK